MRCATSIVSALSLVNADRRQQTPARDRPVTHFECALTGKRQQLPRPGAEPLLPRPNLGRAQDASLPPPIRVRIATLPNGSTQP